MSFISDLFSPTFLMYLGILLLVIALLVVYFESKLRDQNHKIVSMLSLVSTLAEDMNGVKFGLNHLAINYSGGGTSLDESIKTFHVEKNNELISVSDDDEEYEDDDENEEEDDDEEEEEEDDEEEDDGLELEENLDNFELEETDDVISEDEDEDEDEDEVEDIKILKLNINENSNLESIEDLTESETVISENDKEKLNTDLKSINIHLEEKKEPIDYKKLTLQKLRSIVTEKGLTTDSSKLKKQEIFKLLGIE